MYMSLTKMIANITWEVASIMDTLQALVPNVAISTDGSQCQVCSTRIM